MASINIRVPAEDRRQQIIDVARELFASKGYEGTTTRELAERIGVNEALLFRHFPSKDELYWSVLQHMIETRGTKDRLREHLRAGISDRETLIAVARDILNRSVQLTRLLFYCVLEKHELSERFLRTHVIAYHEILADYIRIGIEQGRFRQTDPLLAARAFIGMFAYHFQTQELLGGRDVQQFDSQEVIARLVDIWLEGMQPKTRIQAKNTPKKIHHSRQAAEKATR